MRQNMNVKQTEEYGEWLGSFSVKWRESMRKEYLIQESKRLQKYLDDFYLLYDLMAQRGFSWVEKSFNHYYLGIEKKEKQLSRLKKELSGHGKADNGITDEMIERARDYPMEELAGGKGLLKCVFHEDRSPSMLIKNNYAYCFGCGKSSDTIAWLMEVEGMGFADAVRRLN